MSCWAAGGIILSSVATRYQLGLDLQAGTRTEPAKASTFQPNCESAMNCASSTSTSAANAEAKLALSNSRKPSCGGRIGGAVEPGGELATRVLTDSPVSGTKAAT